MNRNPKVTEYISLTPEAQQELLETLRELIHQTLAQVSEEIKWGFPVFATDKNIAYLRRAKKHVTLGFYHPEKIKDPGQLLQGSGNTLKHLKIFKAEDINAPLIAQWLKEMA